MRKSRATLFGEFSESAALVRSPPRNEPAETFGHSKATTVRTGRSSGRTVSADGCVETRRTSVDQGLGRGRPFPNHVQVLILPCQAAVLVGLLREL